MCNVKVFKMAKEEHIKFLQEVDKEGRIILDNSRMIFNQCSICGNNTTYTCIDCNSTFCIYCIKRFEENIVCPTCNIIEDIRGNTYQIVKEDNQTKLFDIQFNRLDYK